MYVYVYVYAHVCVGRSSDGSMHTLPKGAVPSVVITITAVVKVAATALLVLGVLSDLIPVLSCSWINYTYRHHHQHRNMPKILTIRKAGLLTIIIILISFLFSLPPQKKKPEREREREGGGGRGGGGGCHKCIDRLHVCVLLLSRKDQLYFFNQMNICPAEHFRLTRVVKLKLL